jgi:isopentenyl phosphate kinase
MYITPTSSAAQSTDAVAAATAAASAGGKTRPYIRLIKLGGAAITQKSTFETIDCDALETLIAQIARTQAQLQEQYDCVWTILVHGAGSFGHFQAKKYSVNSGLCLDDNSYRANCFDATRQKGFALTRLSVQKLNMMVATTLLQHNLPASCVSPCNFSSLTPAPEPAAVANADEKVDDRLCNNSDTSFDPQCNLGRHVESLLKAGIIPCIHGDVILHGKSNGCRVLSGDTIMELMASFFHPIDSVIFVSDVNGIYDRDPRMKQSSESNHPATLIAALEVDSDGNANIPNMACAEHGMLLSSPLYFCFVLLLHVLFVIVSHTLRIRCILLIRCYRRNPHQSSISHQYLQSRICTPRYSCSDWSRLAILRGTACWGN